ncbi:MAG: isoprenylcysteine carboxylmethyltransferase family protein [Chloroflexi bacterium]|nr:isoprenylcysteine carboxylmethyltransferase family protein [Chloroflexota bacterium]MCL5110722.1 isoprenylcysteine carboxylmethyltransferase family protein [Chloroflexota bacterium]
MPNETPFQIALAFSTAAFLAVRAYYRLKTGTLQEVLDSSKDSNMERMLLPILGVLVLGMLIWLINPARMRWSALALPGWARWGGAGIVVVALALLIWVHQTLGGNFSSTLKIRERHKLVTAGPYRWVRHPMYSGIFLWAAGVPLITANWFAILVPAWFALFFLLRVPDEEKMMIEAFGDKYRDYGKRTGRFWPRRSTQ